MNPLRSTVKLAVLMLLIITTISACKKPLICGFGLYDCSCHNLGNTDSKISLFDNTSRMDTTLAHINGQVLYKDTANGDSTTQGELFGATILIRNLNDTLAFGNVTSFDGTTDFFAKPGEYSLHISSICYNTLTIQSLSFESGMVVNLKVILGDGGGRNTFRLTEDNRLEEILPDQLNN